MSPIIYNRIVIFVIHKITTTADTVIEIQGNFKVDEKERRTRPIEIDHQMQVGDLGNFATASERPNIDAVIDHISYLHTL